MRKLRWASVLLILAAAGFMMAFLPWKMSHAVRVPLSGTPADQGLAYQEVKLQPSDARIDLAGWWIPAAKPVATMLFVHGGNGNKADPYFNALGYYDALVERGISVLAIDLRNHGASGASASGKLTFGAEEKHDAAAGIAWLRSREPSLPVFATAVSMGGASLIHMNALPVRTDGLILVDPVLNNRDVIDRSLHATLGLPQWSLRPTGWAAQQWFIADLDDPGAVARTSRTPILLISDAIDPVTTPDHARTLAAANPAVTLALIPPTARDAVTRDQGLWAGHESALRRAPELTLAAIDRFLNTRIAAARASNTGQGDPALPIGSR